uniref:Uncharacterized protein n=1 Tax=Setaria italica TaxID=4555 RepID=K3ZFL7_SETIT
MLDAQQHKLWRTRAYRAYNGYSDVAVLSLRRQRDGTLHTNQAMVEQLNILRKEVYRGYYTLDNFISQDSSEEKEAN